MIQTNNPMAKVGDWAILRKDDGANESGIYLKKSTGWIFVQDITNFDEIVESIIATDVEFEEGTKEGKAASVKQIKAFKDAVASDFDRLGNDLDTFYADVTNNYASKESLLFEITDEEALDDFTNA